jgi:deoxyribose-phosphate aldolase
MQIEISHLVEVGRSYMDHLPDLIKPSRKPTLASYLDNALHDPAATPEAVRRFCDEAGINQIATVFINPVFVAMAKKWLAETEVRVGTVAGFPLGAFSPKSKLFEAKKSLESGADEIDMVIQVGMLKAGEYSFIFEEIQKMSALVHSFDALLKVILEVCLLDRFEKIMGSLISKAAGADFVKTSTGFSSGGATVEDVELMRRVVGVEMGVKAAGGIRTLHNVHAMIDAGADRIGTRLASEILIEYSNSGGS